jgi:hypothetical protein
MPDARRQTPDTRHQTRDARHETDGVKSPISRLQSLVSCLLSPVSCLLSPVSRLLSPVSEGWPLASIAIFPLLLVVWRRSLPVTFFAVSADDFHRTLYAWEVTQGHWLPSDLWPPLQFWLEASVLQVYPHLLAVPYLVNLVAATGTLVCLMLLGRALGLDRLGAALQLIAAATLSWFIWLSLSGLAEPIYFLCIALTYLGCARWRASGGEAWLWVAAFGLLLAGMVRFDGWGHGLVFSLVVAWLWWRAPAPRPHLRLVAAAIPWVFPIAWLLYQYATHGKPFYFSDMTRGYFLATHGPAALSERLLWQVRDLWHVAGITIPVSLIGLWLMRRRPGVVMLTLMWLGSFALLVQSTLNYTITMNNPVRLVVVHALLLSPGVGLAFQQLARRGWGAALAVAALLAAVVLPRVGELPNYPNGLAPDVMAVGQQIDRLRSEGRLRADEHIVVEVIFWDYIPLHVITNDPAAVEYDRAPTLVLKPNGEHTLDDQKNPSLLALPPAALRAELERRNVRLLVAYSKRAIKNLQPIARETLHTGRFHVFVLESPPGVLAPGFLGGVVGVDRVVRELPGPRELRSPEENVDIAARSWRRGERVGVV